MSATLLSGAVFVAQILLVAAMGFAALRVLWGPRAQDRVLALDTLYINAAMLLLVFGIRTGAMHYFHAALLITLALPKRKQQFIREILYGCYEHENEFDQACGPVWWDKARQNQAERQKSPVDAHQLERWFANPLVRLILGERRAAIHAHLMTSETK